MKKFIILLALSCISIFNHAQTKKAIQVFKSDGQVLTSLSNDLDSIIYNIDDSSNGYFQEIYYSDSIYKMPVDIIDSIIISNVEFPAGLVFSEGIGDWTELRVANDGTLYMEKKDNSGLLIKSFLVTKGNQGRYGFPVIYDKNGDPKYIGMNELTFVVDSCYNDSIDLTIVHKDSVAYYYEGLKLTIDNTDFSRRRAWSDLTPGGRVASVLQLCSGVIGVAGGYLTMAVSGLAEGATLGTSTLGVAAGALMVYDGSRSYNDAVRKIWEPNYSNAATWNNVAQTYSVQSAGIEIAGLQIYLGGNHVPEAIGRGLNVSGWISYIMSISQEMIEMRYGSAVRLDDMRAYYNNRVITSDINKKEYSKNESIVLNGYIDPTITVSLRDGLPLENEYGIVVYSNEVDFRDRSIIKNGSGGNIDLTLKYLEPAQYYYQTYYIDKTNGISLLGEPKSFKVIPELPYIVKFEQTGSECKINGFINDDKKYSFKYDCAVTVRFKESENVEDWGYVYEDLDGEQALISLKGFPLTYTDTRYAYYRNETKSKVRLYGYLKMKGEDDYYYGNPRNYDVKYMSKGCPDNNHPHAIDLGLPSGTMWACCNVGANKPEDYGGYFAWGEVTEKLNYDVDTYEHHEIRVMEDPVTHIPYEFYFYTDIGADIAGSGYDVATRSWGVPWRMPTLEQWNELSTNTIYEEIREENYNESVMRIIGPNGNTIILPFTGRKSGTSLSETRIDGYYWSSTSYRTSSSAYDAKVYSRLKISSSSTFFGECVRPVRNY